MSNILITFFAFDDLTKQKKKGTENEKRLKSWQKYNIISSMLYVGILYINQLNNQATKLKFRYKNEFQKVFRITIKWLMI